MKKCGNGQKKCRNKQKNRGMGPNNVLIDRKKAETDRKNRG